MKPGDSNDRLLTSCLELVYGVSSLTHLLGQYATRERYWSLTVPRDENAEVRGAMWGHVLDGVSDTVWNRFMKRVHMSTDYTAKLLAVSIALLQLTITGRFKFPICKS
jgi:hypothetical protein